MQTLFETVAEDLPGQRWQSNFNRSWPAYKRWFLSAGLKDRPTYHECRTSLKKYMPELVDVYDRLCELSGGSDLTARFLSLYRPPAYISGCSQIIWPEPNIRLIRNYDYSPKLIDGMILKSRWLGQDVIAMTDSLIGVLDGINENGLCVSLTFGGSKHVGDGFGIPIILRYILETCITARQAEKALKRIPTHMAYNVSALDKNGCYFTAHLFPGQQAIIKRKKRIATNHQPFDKDWSHYARATQTLEREKVLENYLHSQDMSLNKLIDNFHQAPLYSKDYKIGFGTLYTSVYYPVERVLELRWPDSNWRLGFDSFENTQRVIHYVDKNST